MPDFPIEFVDLLDGDEKWGPFNRDFADMIPTGDGIPNVGSIDTSVYLGVLDRNVDLSDQTEITNAVIDTGATLSGSILSLYFKYPGTAYKGQKATIFFQVTLNIKPGVHTVIDQGIYIR